MMKMHEVADDYCIFKLYIHYSGVIIFATKKPRREQTIMIGRTTEMSQSLPVTPPTQTRKAVTVE